MEEFLKKANEEKQKQKINKQDTSLLSSTRIIKLGLLGEGFKHIYFEK